MKFLALFVPLIMSAQALAGSLTLTADNTLVLDTQMDAQSVSVLMAKALVMDSKLKSNEPIYLVLYTPGGSIDDGLTFISFMKALNRPVHTITLFAASMGKEIDKVRSKYTVRPHVYYTTIPLWGN
jgi:ATP-dependent protease ClpP protease subunit